MSGDAADTKRCPERECAILVVDDIEDNLVLMTEVFADEPWTVVTARDAAEALALVETQPFDLFLLDVQMPDMDGFELCRRLKRVPETRDVPVVFITAERKSTASVIQGLDVGGFDYITKPFAHGELLARVRVMLRLRTAERRFLAIQQALAEQNESLTAVNERLAESCQEMLDQRSELMRKTRELEHATQVRSQFLARMSHELRTPLNAITGFAQLMSADRKNTLTPRQMQRLEKIRRNSIQLLNLINDILDISKIDADRLVLDVASVDLPAVMRDCSELIAPLLEGKPVTLNVEAPQALPNWQGDELRLRQIVTNLLTNAAKFTESGVITLLVSNEGEQVSISVRDSGIGIAPEHLRFVFDAFRQVDSSSTRKAGGTGLGLAICRKLCTLMNGTIRAASEPGEGSQFIVKLPWIVPVASTPDAKVDRAEGAGDRRVVVLCTSDPGMVDLFQVHLGAQGIETRKVEPWAAASGALEEESADGVIYDLRSEGVVDALRLLTATGSSLSDRWFTAWTDDHQLGCLFQLDGVIVESLESPEMSSMFHALPGESCGVLVVSDTESVRQRLCDVLAAHAHVEVHQSSMHEAIDMLAVGDNSVCVVDLGHDPSTVSALVARIRRVPEWAPVRIVGAVPRTGLVDEKGGDVASCDDAVGRYGVSTPTLLFDFAERVVAKHEGWKVGELV